jgi:hypothetical protein
VREHQALANILMLNITLIIHLVVPKQAWEAKAFHVSEMEKIPPQVQLIMAKILHKSKKAKEVKSVLLKDQTLDPHKMWLLAQVISS